MKTSHWLALGGATLVLLYLASSNNGSSMSSSGPLLRSFNVPRPPSTDESARFRAALPGYAQQYAEAMLRVANDTGVAPELIFAIGDQETRWGTNPLCKPPGNACTGDNGHGRGLMQIDDRSNADWLRANDWTDPETNIRRGVQILLGKKAYLKSRVPADLLPRACVAAYNAGEGNVAKSIAAGEDVDSKTAGRNYSARVLSSMSTVA